MRKFLLFLGVSLAVMGISCVNAYNAGDRVTVNGSIYECKPYPYTGWCNIGGPYSPGTGANWSDAWVLVSTGNNNTSSNSNASGTTSNTSHTSTSPQNTSSSSTTSTTSSANASTTVVLPVISNTPVMDKPGIPAIGWTPSVFSPEVTISALLPWGENGDRANLLDGDKVIASVNLQRNTPNSQKIVLSASNQPIGQHEYCVQLCNSMGCTNSNKVKAYVAPSIAGIGASVNTQTGQEVGIKPFVQQKLYINTVEGKNASTGVLSGNIQVTPMPDGDVSMNLRRAYSATQTGNAQKIVPNVLSNMVATGKIDTNITQMRSVQNKALLSFVIVPGFSKDLALKSKGNEVTMLQKWLQDNGLFTAKIDGIYGITTRVAIIRVQRLSGIAETGRWDGETRNFFEKQYLASK